MKKSLLTLILIFTTLYALPQVVRVDTVKTDNILFRNQKQQSVLVQNNFTFSAGIRALGIEQLPKILNQTNSSDLKTAVFNGLIFKYNDNQISYRFGGSLIKEDISFRNECEDCEITEGKLTDYQIRTGFEKSMLYTRLQPYFGAEIGYRSNQFKGNSRSAGGTYSVTPYDVVTEKAGIVLGPLAGIRLNLVDHFTISAEAGFDIYYSREKQEKTFRDASRTRTSYTDNKVDFLSKPLGSFSLQYNFGLNN